MSEGNKISLKQALSKYSIKGESFHETMLRIRKEYSQHNDILKKENAIEDEKRRNRIVQPSKKRQKEIEQKLLKLNLDEKNRSKPLSFFLDEDEINDLNNMVMTNNPILESLFQITPLVVENIVTERIAETSKKVLSKYIVNKEFKKGLFIKHLRTMKRSEQDKHLRNVRWLLKKNKKTIWNKDKTQVWFKEIEKQIAENKGKKQVEDLYKLCAAFYSMKEAGILSISITEIAKLIQANFMTFKSVQSIKNYLEMNKKYKIDIKITKYEG